MRPVKLKTIVEHLDSIVSGPERVEKKKTSPKRAHEILRALKDLQLVSQTSSGVQLTTFGAAFLKAAKEFDRDKLSGILLEVCDEYATILAILSENVESRGYTCEKICESAKKINKKLNKAVADNLIEWGRRLGTIQKNLLTSGEKARYYCPTGETSSSDLERDVFACASKEMRVGVAYISIPHLREEICEKRRLKRKDFDHMLIELCQKYVGRVELTGTIITSPQRKTPTRRLIFNENEQNTLFSWRFEAKWEKGIEFSNRRYSLLAVHIKR